MSFGIVYKAINKINGKVYIGQTIKSIEERIRKHYYSATRKKDNYHFHNALRKYNKDDFIWEIICGCSNKEEMDDLEHFYIIQCDSFNSGYNSTLGGEGTHGHIPSKATRKKMSISAKNRTDNRRLGYKEPLEVRKKMSNSAKLRITPSFSDTHRANMSEAKKGKIITMGVKEKISISLKGVSDGGKKISVIILPDNNNLVVDNVNEFCRIHSHLNLSSKCLRRCASIKYKQNHHRGFKCIDYDQEDHRNLAKWGGSVEWH